MSSPQLPNYLRSHRKRLALSQGEVAFLLGQKSGGQVSRHEYRERLPSLETALAYEVIFKQPLSELFGGLYQKAEREVAERAKALVTLKGKSQKNVAAARLLQELATIKN